MNKKFRLKIFFAAALAVCLVSFGYLYYHNSRTVRTKTQVSGYDTSQASEYEKESSEEISEAEESDDEKLYDTTPISSAYLSGDTSGLDDFQLEIYNAAVSLLESCINDSMTDYEKELAVHDKIILTAEYDLSNLSIFETHGKNAVNPYGTLIEGKAICSGYTTTFQMLMDMLEIPCKSIFSEDFTGEEHAWNMVEIEDEWYYVDVTWDDPVPDEENRPVRHKYFNVTEDYMALKHVWDSTGLPEADSYENSYIAKNIYDISDLSEINDIMLKQIENMCNCAYFMLSDLGIEFDTTDGIDEIYEADDYPELKEIMKEFVNVSGEYEMSFQRVAFGDEIVLAATVIRQ